MEMQEVRICTLHKLLGTSKHTIKSSLLVDTQNLAYITSIIIPAYRIMLVCTSSRVPCFYSLLLYSIPSAIDQPILAISVYLFRHSCISSNKSHFLQKCNCLYKKKGNIKCGVEPPHNLQPSS